MVISMDRWKGKVAVVTGASAGIGVAIVEQLVEAGVNVVGLARRVDRVEKLAKKLEKKSGKLHAFKADMTKEEDILEAFEWTKKNVGPVSILVNNAGVVKSATLTEGETHLWKAIYDTNVLGLCIATREAVKQMRDNSIDGHIIHINSIAGHRVLGGSSVYSSSKFAVTALTETLRQELNSLKTKIKITSVSPGFVETEIMEANNIVLDEKIKTFLENAPRLYAPDIADAVTYALSTPPHVQIHELTIKPVGETL